MTWFLVTWFLVRGLRSTLTLSGCMVIRIAFILVAAAGAGLWATAAPGAEVETTTTPATSASPLRIVVKELNGKVQWRNRDDEPWTLVRVGDELSESARLRT